MTDTDTENRDGQDEHDDLLDGALSDSSVSTASLLPEGCPVICGIPIGEITLYHLTALKRLKNEVVLGYRILPDPDDDTARVMEDPATHAAEVVAFLMLEGSQKKQDEFLRNEVFRSARTVEVLRRLSIENEMRLPFEVISYINGKYQAKVVATPPKVDGGEVGNGSSRRKKSR
jgi:hypothetical protein